ncbi:hypothetical protein L6452_16320 [Arctium lappa]|uniref:Uncharacterized protein n=1 Tax=Arctium lappa TaxID=4217 RepID=A0ACB9C0B5_ARCLA|nr:hypothetical protein L6452_16320 [Arctium lappa]
MLKRFIKKEFNDYFNLDFSISSNFLPLIVEGGLVVSIRPGKRKIIDPCNAHPKVIDFSVVKPKRDSLNKVQRILERSIADRSFSLRSNDEEDEVVLVSEVAPTEDPSKEGEDIEEEREGEREEEITVDATAKSAAARRAEQLELARQGREKSRKRSAASTGVDPRRDFQACLSFFAQTEGLRASFPDVKKRADEALERDKVALEAVEAEKKKVESLKTKLVEAQNETIKFRDHVLELEALTSKLEVEKIKATTAAATSADEVTSLLKKVESLEGDVKDLEEENRQIEAFSRLTARAALMRRHLSGKNPMVSAAEELKTYLDTVGIERDLDEDDDLEGSDNGKEAATAKTDVMQEQLDAPPS